MLENIIVKCTVLYDTAHSYLPYNDKTRNMNKWKPKVTKLEYDRLRNSALLYFKNSFPIKRELPYHTYRQQHTLPHLPLHRNNPRKRSSNNHDHPKSITRETIINPIVHEASVGYPCCLIDATKNDRCK